MLKDKKIFFLWKRNFVFSENFLISNLEDLRKFSLFLSKIVCKNSFLAVCGEMGSGKTTLINFFCQNIGVKERVNSPTFGIMRNYWIWKEMCFLNHFDFFKISDNDDFSIFEDFKNERINVLEWADLSYSFWVNELNLIYLKIDNISTNSRNIFLAISK